MINNNPVKAENLLQVLLKYSQLTRTQIDPNQLKDAVSSLAKDSDLKSSLIHIENQLGVKTAKYLKEPDKAKLPFLVNNKGLLEIVTGLNDAEHYIVGSFDESGSYSERAVSNFEDDAIFVIPSVQIKFIASDSQIFRLVLNDLFEKPKTIIEMAIAGLFLTLLAVAISLFSIQVYDRVIPSGALGTLGVLMSGATLALIFEFILRLARSGVVERVTDQVDQNLSRSVMSRFLGVRLEKIPPSVGGATQVLKGYETVRSFLMTLLSTITVDLPIAIFLLVVVFLIAGNLVYIPLAFVVVGTFFALFFKNKMDKLSALSQNAHSRKIGIIAETVEGAESIKANNGRWRMLSHWLSATDEARVIDNRHRNVSENAKYVLMLFQQFSYISVIAVGSIKVIDGELSMGALIGCSILTGRILTPVSQLPSLLISWSQAKVALKGLEHYWNLDQEVNGTQSVYVEHLEPSISVRDVQTKCYAESSLQLSVSKLDITPGERLGIVGSVGSGKTSLLRLLGGLIAAEKGSVHLSSHNIQSLSRTTLANHISYVGQSNRLISGTLRDNLILGLQDPGDEVLSKWCEITGAMDYVIAPSPKGFDTTITETGQGLSGGQKQLIELTRALLKKPKILLLDEPTASLDQALEQKIVQVLNQYLNDYPQTTLIAVSHRPNVFNLFKRVIIVANGKVAMDGPKSLVLEQITKGTKNA